MKVLRLSLFTFIKEYLEIFPIDPLKRCYSLANSVMSGFRSRFLRPNTLQIVHEQGPEQARRKQSLMAKKYLNWVGHKTGQDIRTAQSINGSNSIKLISMLIFSLLGEQRLKLQDTNVWCDGAIYNEQGQLTAVLEVFGCRFHACPLCTNDMKALWIDGKHTNEYIYLHTMRRLNRIKAELNCTVLVIWEHSVRKQYKHNVIMRNFFDSLIYSWRAWN